MKIGCFCMVRNEAMMIPAFLDQIREFFDISIFLDHSSTDCTPKIIRDHILNTQGVESAKLYHLVSEGQPQMEVSNFFARKLFNDYNVDYVFLLDCDEFLPFGNRMELEHFLQRVNSNSAFEAIYYKWRNLCPEFLDGKKDIFKNKFYLSKKNEKKSTKIILTKAILKDDDWQLVQGNHYVVHGKGNKIISVIDNSIELYHIPIQSYNKFMLKLMAGSLRLRLEKKLLSKGLGAHWDTLNSKISRLGIDYDEILSYSMGYPDKG
ncbi:glycosyltransferase family 2 protein [Pectobacterium polaris]|uniref:glycosyltransferase family 2 protein n=1 Tax=Pectobacterium polaris TaxID=2042057 RepID=UPI0015816C02|nr:glycosyltransferase family 2 protein [Pectobacterium polaris]